MMVEEEDDREINVDTDSRCSGTVDEESCCGSRSSSIVDGVDDVQIRSCSATGSDGGGSLLSPGSEHNHRDIPSPGTKLEDRGVYLTHHLHHHRRTIGRLDDDRRSLTPSPPPSTTSNASSGTPSSGQALPFSISRLLGSDFEANNNSLNGRQGTVISTEKGTDSAPTLLLHHQGTAISQHEAITSLYSHPAIVQFSGSAATSGARTSTSGGLCPLTAAGLVYSTAAGVIRVPAHRPPPPPPLGGPTGGGNGTVPALAAPFPWLAASMDPASLQRSAAAAAFASQVVKERLTGRKTLWGMS
ncbi:hypothetical protein C0J52_24665 [Blattella germanica]|nr:hypothetical protein C0J52_24665 [Blattella germanica]